MPKQPPEKKPAAKAPAKTDPKAAAKAAPKAAKSGSEQAEAAGHDHSSQSEVARRAYEKLHGTAAQRANVPGQNKPVKKGGFDPHQFRGNQKGFGGGANMIRRTQSRGGGSGGGGGGGGGGSGAS